MQSYHAVVWLDHLQAKIFHFDRDKFESEMVSTSLPHHQIHNKAGTIDGKRAEDDQVYYENVVKILEAAREWLILGPGRARDELARHVRERHPNLGPRILGVEAADHPTDAQIVAYARSYFRSAERMLP